MLIKSQFIVYYNDTPLPEESFFCPSLWNFKDGDFDSDGDFYHNGHEGYWSDLEISTREEIPTKLNIGVFREFKPIGPAHVPVNILLEVSDLERFFEYRKAGRYENCAIISNIQYPAICLLDFITPSVEFYKDFLTTVHAFLKFSKGVELEYLYCEEQFYEKFIK